MENNVLSKQLIVKYILQLDFSEDAAKLYLVLSENGPLTISQASRLANIERTKLYRMVDTLTDSGLIEKVLKYKSQKLQAAGLEQIKRLIANKKAQLAETENHFDEFSKTLNEMTRPTGTQVRYYKGREGIKQILWNELSAEREAVGYTHRNLEEVVGKKFFSNYARELERKKINFRDIRTESFLASTNETECDADPIMTGSWAFLPDSVIHLTHNMDIYNDTVAIYYWENEDFFGIEIENKQIAETQKSIFETLWHLAKQYKVPSKEYPNVVNDFVNLQK